MANAVKTVAIESLSLEDVATICDHTFLNRSEAYKANAPPGESPVALRRHDFERFLVDTLAADRLPYAICVRPEDVANVKGYIQQVDKGVKVASVVGFPDGALYSTAFKISETNLALGTGAEEIDMVMNYHFLGTTEEYLVRSELDSLVELCHDASAVLKVILETSTLSPVQISKACLFADDAGVDFVKTSTGFGAYGARVEDLRLIRENFPRGIKISGGVNEGNYQELLDAAAGVERMVTLDPQKIRIGESSLLS